MTRPRSIAPSGAKASSNSRAQPAQRRGKPDGARPSKSKAKANNNANWLGSEIRTLRKLRRMSLMEMARLTDRSIGNLSQIERGVSQPSVVVLQSIGTALGVPVGWFFPQGEAADPSDRGIVVRSGKRRCLNFESGITDYLLSPHLNGALEFLLCEFQPNAISGESPYTHEGEEAGVVVSGQLELWIDDDHFLLETGDSFSFLSRRAHRYRNPGTGIARVIWVVTPPSF